jgi:hypothetical protein
MPSPWLIVLVRTRLTLGVAVAVALTPSPTECRTGTQRKTPDKVCRVGVYITSLDQIPTPEAESRRRELVIVQRQLIKELSEVADKENLEVFESLDENAADVQILLTFSPTSGKGQALWFRDGDSVGQVHKANAWWERLPFNDEKKTFMKSKGWELQERPISIEDVLHAVGLWRASGSHSSSFSFQESQPKVKTMPGSNLKSSETNDGGRASAQVCQYRQLSQNFRDVAGDAFDKLESLESIELEGKIYYQPANKEAGLAVLKAKRIASSEDEVNLSYQISFYYSAIDNYRLDAELVDLAIKNPGSSVTIPSASELAEDKARQGKTRESIRACIKTPTQPVQEQSSTGRPSQTVAGSGKLLITSAPGSAEVFVDGAFVGNAPASLKLSTGNHVIRAVLSGYKEQMKSITVMADSELRLAFNLEKQKNGMP